MARAPVAGRAVVTWEEPGEPIMLTLYGPDGEVAVPLLPKRALTLAQELLTRGVQAIKADQWDTPPPRLRRNVRYRADCVRSTPSNRHSGQGWECLKLTLSRPRQKDLTVSK